VGAFEARFAARSGSTDGEAFGALDIGAGKIACLIAAATPETEIDRPIDVAGIAGVPVRHGAAADPESLCHLARVALDQALRMAGDVMPPFAAAYVGPDLQTTLASGAIRIKGPVGPREVAGAIAAARASTPLAGRRILHCAPLRYSLDEGDGLIDPRGQTGEMLEAEICLVHAPKEAVAALERALTDAGAALAFIVAAPFAAGQGVLLPQEREAGAVVIDLGESGAGLAIFQHGGLQHAEHIPGGGARLTRDLAVRLNTTFPVAERAKLLHGALNGEGDASEALEVPVVGEDGRLEPGLVLRGAFAEALAPRLEEIFTRIAARLDDAGFGVGEGAFPVALTGGVSQTPGLRAIAARVLKRPVRIAAPLGFAGLDEGAGGLAVAAGLVRCGLERAEAASPQKRVRPPAAPSLDTTAVTRRVGGALTWLKENF
jgi:cell division protein FtsA